jgi:Transposase DNA-binding
LLEQISDAVGESVPMACQDWANTKAAYRFFSNERVNEADILAGHFQATKDRFIATQGPILVLHDTTEFSFRASPALQKAKAAAPQTLRSPVRLAIIVATITASRSLQTISPPWTACTTEPVGQQAIAQAI